MKIKALATFVTFFYLNFSLPALALLQGNEILVPEKLGSPILDAGLKHSFPAPLNLKAKTYVSFWLKFEPSSPEAGKETAFYVEISGQGASGKALARRFSHKTAGEWQKIVIPLAAFSPAPSLERVLGIHFFLEGQKGAPQAKFLIQGLLFGSHYPEDTKGQEIRMQNRVSSFKIGHRVATEEFAVKEKEIPLSLTLTFVDPYLEEIRFEVSSNEGKEWVLVKSFFDHSIGGTYSMNWKLPQASGVLVRARGIDVLGGQTILAGPFHVVTG